MFTGVWCDYLKSLVCLWWTGTLSPEILKGEAMPLPHTSSPLSSSPLHKGQHGGCLEVGRRERAPWPDCQVGGASQCQPARASLSFAIHRTAIIPALLQESGSLWMICWAWSTGLSSAASPKPREVIFQSPFFPTFNSSGLEQSEVPLVCLQWLCDHGKAKGRADRNTREGSGLDMVRHDLFAKGNYFLHIDQFKGIGKSAAGPDLIVLVIITYKHLFREDVFLLNQAMEGFLAWLGVKGV